MIQTAHASTAEGPLRYACRDNCPRNARFGLPRIFCGASANRRGSIRMPRMDARIAPLRLTLGLAASALSRPAGGSGRNAGGAGAAAGLQHRDLVFRAAAALGGAETERGGGARASSPAMNPRAARRGGAFRRPAATFRVSYEL